MAEQYHPRIAEPKQAHFSDSESMAGPPSEHSDQNFADTDPEPRLKPDRRKWYKQKRTWIVCAVSSLIITAIVVPILIFVALPKISQIIINGSSLSFNSVLISFAPPPGTVTRRDVTLTTNNSFWMDISSALGNTGPFPATLDFPDPIQVYFNQTLIGTLNLPSVSVSGGGGGLNTVQQFKIVDVDAFSTFSKYLLSQPTFEWTLVSNATIHALGRTIENLSLNKVVTLNGMAGFPNVEIQKFELPSNNPAGGIDMKITTLLVNTSPIGIRLGTIVFDIAYKSTFIGQVTAENVVLKNGNNTIILAGRMVPQTNQSDLDTMSELFSRYIGGFPSNTTAKGISAAPDGINQIGWLTAGFTSLTLNIALRNPDQMHLISGISIGTMDFAFSEANPFSPIASSTGPNPLSASFSIPFGFSLSINAVENNLTIATQSTGPIAEIHSTYGSATSNQNAGILNFTLPTSPLQVLPGMNSAFVEFVKNLTVSSNVTFLASGNATVQSTTPIGNVTLSNIPFNAPATLTGVNGLNWPGYPLIKSVDVTGGTTSALQMVITTAMYNPSNVQVGAGDVALDLLFSDVLVGNVLLNNLTLFRGENIVNAVSNFNPAATREGTQLLTNFISGQTSQVKINGNANSSKIASLADGLSLISLETNLTGLSAKLIGGTFLQISDQTINNSIADASVIINNPFTASLNILYIKSVVKYSGYVVGNINVDSSGSPIVIPGNSSTKTSALPLVMDLRPESVVNLLRASAKVAGLDIRPLEVLLQLGEFPFADNSVKMTPDLFDGFNIINFVKSALAKLTVDLELFTEIQIGDYKTNLTLTQTGVPNTIDDSVAKLIPIVGQPVVQKIVAKSNLGIDGILLSDPTDTSATTALTGKITGTGPLDASIVFGDPLQISWQNKMLGSLAMGQPVEAKANVGATLDVTGSFQLADASTMESFTTYLLGNKDFEWHIAASNLRVTALGYTFVGVTFAQDVSLKGINGFKDENGETQLKITQFGIPGVDPASGLTLSVQSTLVNPSTVGVNLDSIQFDSYFGTVLIGYLSANKQAIQPNGAASQLQLGGRLIPQTSDEGLDAISTVFGNFIHDTDTSLNIQGSAVSGPKGPVGWLTNAFKTLKLTVTLPGQKVDIIKGVTLNQLSLDFTPGAAYNPPSSSNDLQAQFALPPQFKFPLNIVQLSQNAVVKVNGDKMAELNMPVSSATTNGDIIKTSFSNVPFAVYESAKPVFNDFTKSLTLGSSNSFGLSGVANSVAETAVGRLTLNNITFDVTTSLKGFNNFGGSATLSNVKVVGGTKDYIDISLQVTIQNPSGITISVGDVSFAAQYKGFPMGTTYINGLTLKPGANLVPASFHLAPGPGAQVASVELLSGFLQARTATLNVLGTSNSTQIDSLKDAFAGVKLTADLVGMSDRVIVSTVVQFQVVQLLVEKVAKAQFTLFNPLDAAFTIPKLTATVSYAGDSVNPALNLSTFTAEFPGGFTVPAKGTATSPLFQISLSADPLKVVGIILTHGLTFPVSVDQVAQVLVGDFPAYLQYHEDNIPNTLEVIGLASLNGVNLTNIPGVTLPNSSTTASSNISSSLLTSLVSSLSKSIAVPTSIIQPGSKTTTQNDKPTPTTSDDDDTTTAAGKPTPAPTAQPGPSPSSTKTACGGGFWGSMACDVTSFVHWP